MKKSIIFLTALLLTLSLLVAGCGKQGGNTTESGSGSGENTEKQTEKQTEKTEPSGTAKETEAGSPADTTGSVVTEEPTGEDFPPFDKSQPWDGVSACIEWYVNGDFDVMKLSDAYDLYGLTYLVEGAATKTMTCYDPNYMVIYDTNGDGDLTDEAGYSDQRVIFGSNFENTEIRLTNDIDLNSKPFTPIGTTVSFRGDFDGQGHTIKNLLVTPESGLNKAKGRLYYYGLFASVAYGAQIKDFTLENVVYEVNNLPTENVEINRKVFIGGVAAYLHETGGGTISGVKVKGLTVRLGGDMSGVVLVEMGGIVGHCGPTTLVQTNNVVTDFAVEDTHTGIDVHTDANNFCGNTDREDCFVDCSVTMKTS